MSERGRYRWRTWLRGKLPARLGWLAPKGLRDCGDHEWYLSEPGLWRCYHCEAGVTDESPWSPEERLAYSLMGLRLLAEDPRPESAQEVRRLAAEVHAAMRAEQTEVRHLLSRIEDRAGC